MRAQEFQSQSNGPLIVYDAQAGPLLARSARPFAEQRRHHQMRADVHRWCAADTGARPALTSGPVANAGRAMLMRLSGQRIVARLRERTYAAALRQEVEFVEKGEGDVLSRLSVDSSIVGER